MSVPLPTTPLFPLSLFLLVPFLSAALAIILPLRFFRRLLALIVPALGVIGASVLLIHLSNTSNGSTIAENIGGYTSGIAIPLAADTFTALMLLGTAIIALAANWFADTVGESKTRFYPALTLLLIGGAWGALLTADIFNLFVFIEVMLMPSFALLAMTGTWARLAAARMFIIVNLVTSLILLAGVSVTYGVVGTTNLAALAGATGPRGGRFAEGIAGNQWQLSIALGMVLLALCIKAAVAPVHTWLPRAYPATSPSVMALFSGLHTKVAVYAIFRVYMTIFEGNSSFAWGILIFMVAGMLIGAFGGLSESTLRGVLAYQMVGGIPFMLIALVFLQRNSPLMLAAALYYILHHMVVACSLIMASGSIEETYGTGRIRPLSGLLRRDPFPSIVFAMGALAIIGFPPFSGVLGKIGLVMGIADDGTWKAWVGIGAIVVAGVGSMISMIYAWRETFWGRDMNAQECDPDLRVRARFVLPSAVMIGLSVVMFLAAGPLFTLTGRAATNLTDTTGYVTAIQGGSGSGFGTVGAVLPPGPSGLDHTASTADTHSSAAAAGSAGFSGSADAENRPGSGNRPGSENNVATADTAASESRTATPNKARQGAEQ